MNKIIYTAFFVKDIPSLIEKFKPKHKNVYAHHLTIEFKPKSLAGIEIGKNHLLKIIGRVYDEKGDVLLTENIKSNNPYPHITLSCSDGISPVYSNELITKAVKLGKVEYFKEPIFIDTIEGYSDGKKEYIRC